LQVKKQQFDLIILDIHLPDGSGLTFCQDIRKVSDVPILFLTANDTELDMVSGLEAGGDDYVTKPFSLAVLRARVSVLLRRKQGQEASQPLEANKIELDSFIFDFEKMTFQKNRVAFELSKTEQKLLYLLVKNKGQTLSREILSERIWAAGTEYVDENALSVVIRRLREKVENDPSNPQFIKTIFGIGYTWAVQL
jgi:DNA-binding response OmpR family regulator